MEKFLKLGVFGEDMKENEKFFSIVPASMSYFLAALAFIAGGFVGYSIGINFPPKSIQQKTQTEIVDTSRVENIYSQPMDSIYKELGIDKTKYTPKQLDSLVSEAYQTILW